MTTTRAVGVILTFAAFIVVLMLTVNPAPNNDLFWQLRAGAEILRTHQAPHADTFSWTRFGTPWVAHEWLSFAIFALVYKAAGFSGLYVLMAACIAVTFTWLVRIALRTKVEETEHATAATVAFVVWLSAVLISRPFFQPRPQLFTYLFLVVLMWALTSARRMSTRELWWLIPVFVLWANLHAGVLIGIGVTAVIAIGDAVEAYVDRGRRDVTAQIAFARHLGMVAVAGFLATLATPYSYHVYENFAATVMNATAMNTVGEWASPDFHTSFGHVVELYLVLTVASMAFSQRRRRLADVVLVVVLIYETLGANRNAPLLAIIGTPIVAEHAMSAVGRVRWMSRLGAGVAYLIAVGAVLGASNCAVSTMRASIVEDTRPLERIALTSIDYTGYPSKACEFIEREGIPSGIRMYNIYGQGGFLIWKLPDHPVFIDGRADIYFGKHLDDVSRMRSMPYDWRSTLDKWHVDMIVSEASDSQARLFLGSPDWALVYADSSTFSDTFNPEGPVNSLIFIRNVAEYRSLINKCRRDCPTAATIEGT